MIAPLVQASHAVETESFGRRHDVSWMQARIHAFLGAEKLAALHRRSVPLDVCTLIAVPGLCIGLVLVCALSSSPVAVGLAVVSQGYVLQWFGLINHEFF